MVLDRTIARRAIRYLKRGVFPPDVVEYFTAGRESEVRQISGTLEEVQQGLSRHCFIEANYGFGKSHMLKVAESLALQRGFAVSWVTINGAEHAFNHPTRYLHSLLENLRVRDVHARGLVALCSHWLQNRERDSLLKWVSHSAPRDVRWAIDRLRKAGTDEDTGYREWYLSTLEGRDVQHRSGSNYFGVFYERVAAAVSLCRAAGCSGVLFLFDEVECIATQASNIRSRLLCYQVLRALVDERRFPYAMFMFAATQDLGAKIVADASSYSEYEAAYPEGFRFVRKWSARELRFLTVRAVTRSDNGELLRRIRDAHSSAYNWIAIEQVSDAFVDEFLKLTSQCGCSQREIVKWFVDALEITQQHSHIKLAI